MHSNKKSNYITLLVFIIATTLITTIFFAFFFLFSNYSHNKHGNFSINDSRIFTQPPAIVLRDNNYFIEFKYGKNSFYFDIASKIQDNKIIFYLPVTTSSGNMHGKLHSDKITDPIIISLIEQGQVFWEEPNGKLIPIMIITNPVKTLQNNIQ